MGMVGEACLPSNAYYPRTLDYTFFSGVHVCWFEHSDLWFFYGFMSLDYGLGTMTATTLLCSSKYPPSQIILGIYTNINYTFVLFLQIHLTVYLRE